MKKIMALTATVSMLALFVLTTQAHAQDGPTLTADPPTVPAAGTHTFTVAGSGFNPNFALNVLPCTIPGAELTPESTQAEIAAAQARISPFVNCNLASVTQVTTDSSGNFSVQVTGDVGANFQWSAGDTAQTQSASVVVFIVEPAAEEEAPAEEEEAPAEEEEAPAEEEEEAPAEEEEAPAEEEDMTEEEDMADEDMDDDMADEDMGDEDMGDDMADDDMGDDMADDMGDDMADDDMADDMGDDMADDMVEDMGDDMVPEGGADTGFGGTAGSDGNSLAVPLAATIAAATLLGGAVLVSRRNT